VFTDGQTDGQKEKSITIYLASSFHSLGGYNKHIKTIVNEADAWDMVISVVCEFVCVCVSAL